jgi:A/G-specific adenine glycosylase
MDCPSEEQRRRIRRRLLAWFARHRRDLPWRQDRDPYRIWVSEVMLQQTQVATVIPYFERFLQQFPTLTHLAAAPEREVLRHWEGLGYYRRARDLHRSARLLTAEYGGVVPNDPAVLGKLAGIGRYTLGAILSQAFERRLPIVEANSQRVLCRVFGQREDPRNSRVRHWLWEVAEALLPMRHVGEFNQALMELGALICTPTAPRCPHCPLADDCTARRLGLQDSMPPRAKPVETVTERGVAVVVSRGTRVLLAQRPDGGRWAGMWEFPHAALEESETPNEAVARFLPELTGIEAEVSGELLTLRHTVTRHRITLLGLTARYQAGRFGSAYYRQGKWVWLRELQTYPVSVPQRRLAKAVLDAHRQPRLFS